MGRTLRMSNLSIDRSFEFPADLPEPGLATRVWRFVNVVWLAVYVYAGYKGVQLWTRFVSDRNKAELYRRQDLRAAQALNRTAIRQEGLLIKACQFIATRADVLPDEWVSTLSGLHDRVPPRPFAMIRQQIERELRRPLAADSDVMVPEVYREFTTRRVLTMELAEGIKVTDVDALERAGISKHAVAQKLIEIFCDQVL